MKKVPLNRLLIQPTVQLSWLEQHGHIEFELDTPLQVRYEAIWNCYVASGFERLVDFLNSDEARPFQLHEQDHCFALLVGADYIQHRHPNFQQRFQTPNLEWSIR